MTYFLTCAVLVIAAVVALVVGEVNDLRRKVTATVSTIDECSIVLRKCLMEVRDGLHGIREEVAQFIIDQRDERDDYWRG